MPVTTGENDAAERNPLPRRAQASMAELAGHVIGQRKMIGGFGVEHQRERASMRSTYMRPALVQTTRGPAAFRKHPGYDTGRNEP